MSVASAQRALASSKPPLPAPVHGHKNVLVIILDDLGTDKLAFYNETPPDCPPYACDLPPNCTAAPTGCVAPYPATPNLDQLRRQGIWFTKAYGCPVCSSARAYIETGRYGFRTGVGRATNTVEDPGDWELSSQEKFLAELVRNGAPYPEVESTGLPYRAGAFGKWHLSTTLPEDAGHAVANGYHRFYGTPGNVSNFFHYDKIEHDLGKHPNIISIDGRQTLTTDTWHASVTRKDALEWMNGQPNSFLCTVGFGPPHIPIQVPPAALLSADILCELACEGLAPGDFLTITGDPPELLKLVYRAMVEALDVEIGNLINGLDPEVRDNTMIFVVGDNGVPGFVADEPPHILTHGKGQVYDLGCRVPLIVAGPLVPGPIPAEGWQSDALVSSVDLWLTIAEITGSHVDRVQPLGPLDSVSFLPVIEDPLSPSNRTVAFSQYFSPNAIIGVPPPSCYAIDRRCTTDGEYKYIRTQTGLDASPCGNPTYSEELYHVASDPEESTELISNPPLSPEAAAAMALLSGEMDSLSGL